MVTKSALQSTVLVPSSAKDFCGFCNKYIVDLFILKKELEFYLEQVSLFAELNETNVELDDDLKPLLVSVRRLIDQEIKPLQQQLTYARTAEIEASYTDEDIRYKTVELLQQFKDVSKQTKHVKLRIQQRIAL